MSCDRISTGDVVHDLAELSRRHDPDLKISLRHLEETLNKRTPIDGQTGGDLEIETGDSDPFPERVQKLIDEGWKYRKGIDEPSVLISPDGDSQFTVKEDGNLYDHEA